MITYCLSVVKCLEVEFYKNVKKIKEILGIKKENEKVEKGLVKDFFTVTIGKELLKKDMVLGEYPVYSGGADRTGYYFNYNANENDIVIAQQGSAGCVNYPNCKFFVASKGYRLSLKRDGILPKYAYYYFKEKEKYLIEKSKLGGIPKLDINILLNLDFYIPPLWYQEYVVKILDKFVKSIEELEIEIFKKGEKR